MPELPRYKCYKEVRALMIAEVRPAALGASELVPVLTEYAPIQVSPHWLNKHNPQVGGYYVLYDDGYASYSPAKAFEEGYTRIS